VRAVNEIEVGQADSGAEARHRIETTRGNIYAVGRVIDTPYGTAALEDFGPGETVRWAFWHAEFHYIVSGSAEVSYSLAPWHDKVQYMSVNPGAYYLIPPGAELTFRVAAGEPLRKLCVIMPKETLYGEVRPSSVQKLDRKDV
jgi:mannose-6-phosphate isomerase-like protein (cupin superfamily)